MFIKMPNMKRRLCIRKPTFFYYLNNIIIFLSTHSFSPTWKLWFSYLFSPLFHFFSFIYNKKHKQSSWYHYYQDIELLHIFLCPFFGIFVLSVWISSFPLSTFEDHWYKSSKLMRSNSSNIGLFNDSFFYLKFSLFYCTILWNID